MKCCDDSARDTEGMLRSKVAMLARQPAPHTKASPTHSMQTLPTSSTRCRHLPRQAQTAGMCACMFAAMCIAVQELVWTARLLPHLRPRQLHLTPSTPPTPSLTSEEEKQTRAERPRRRENCKDDCARTRGRKRNNQRVGKERRLAYLVNRSV